MGSHHHAHDAKAKSIACAVVTVSDTRRAADDHSGDLIQVALEHAGHAIVDRVIVRDERDVIRTVVLDLCGRADVQAVIVTGGTGIARRDVTIESLEDAWTKELPGFGEIFRALSFSEIGAAAFLSRSTAGVIGSTFVAVLPGSPGACELALSRLIVPQLGHVVGLLTDGSHA